MRNSSLKSIIFQPMTHYQFDPDNVQFPSLKSQMARSFPYMCMCMCSYVIDLHFLSLV